MNITKLKQALEIMDCDGNVFAYRDELQICPNTPPNDDAIAKLDELGVFELDEDSGFMCFT